MDQTSPTTTIAEEQRGVQAGKRRLNNLAGYDRYLSGPPGSPVRDFLKNTIAGHPGSFLELLGCLPEALGREPFWVDAAAGLAGPMRELAQRNRCQAAGRIAMAAIDLFPPGALPVSEVDQRLVKKYEIELGNPVYLPEFIAGDMATVQLDRPADLITLVQAMLYVDDPLRVIVNLFNQLRPGGLLIISGDDWWREMGELVPRGGTAQTQYGELMPLVFDHLGKQGIPCAANDPDLADDENDFRTIVLQRRAGVSLTLQAQVVGVTTEGQGYKRVAYAPIEQPVVVQQADNEQA